MDEVSTQHVQQLREKILRELELVDAAIAQQQCGEAVSCSSSSTYHLLCSSLTGEEKVRYVI